ncbi:hypothetical protein [Mycobacterium sp. SP-6446]|uniref:hypothetical protein n=1 Tax=Mycobacterium sp. SP-6446 TaxID=1834162 RepID=UPI00096E95DE|nr:hypothetical protein [Mycobacterium sp. SP-6446]OMC14656.1 hypothetical protein A5736_20665 [Mycobacterium sp. SP-6446]
MARTGPPDDFHNEPTRHAGFGMGERPPFTEAAPTGQAPGEPPPGEYQPDQSVDPFDEESEPTAWYRRPVMLLGWALLVLILIALIVFGITQLLGGDQGTSHVPSTSTTSPTSTTTTTTTTSPSTTTESPSSSSAVEPPAQQPTQQPTQQPSQQPSHRHHMPSLPPVITIPGGPTMTVPPALR